MAAVISRWDTPGFDRMPDQGSWACRGLAPGDPQTAPIQGLCWVQGMGWVQGMVWAGSWMTGAGSALGIRPRQVGEVGRGTEPATNE